MPTERVGNSGARSKWNYHPELPLADQSIFGWPPNFGFLARRFRRNWLSLSERMLLLLIAVAAWHFLYPGLEQAKTFAVGWVVQTWVVNMGLMLAVADSLHWYFYIRRGQGAKLKFDHRDMAEGSRTFSFRDQVHDNMFWSLGSGVLFWTAFQVLTLWAMATMVKLPPFSMLRAAPKKRFGRCRALASTPPERILPDGGTIEL